MGEKLFCPNCVYVSSNGKEHLSIPSFMAGFHDRMEHILRYTSSLSEYRKNLGSSDGETALIVFNTLELSLRLFATGSPQLVQNLDQYLKFRNNNC
jgi:hypothetical protein